MLGGGQWVHDVSERSRTEELLPRLQDILEASL